jgi:hypothetical protein
VKFFWDPVIVHGYLGSGVTRLGALATIVYKMIGDLMRQPPCGLPASNRLRLRTKVLICRGEEIS